MVVLVLAAVLAYPRVGAWYLRTKAIPRMADRYGAEVTVGSIDVAFGHATLRDVRVRAKGGTEEVARLARIDVRFDGTASLLGDAVIAAVDSVTGREGEPYIELVRRAAADPVGRWVKLADNLDNSDETRLARLPEATAARLREKYASARRLLRAACAAGADEPSRDESKPATPS